jgi:cell wall-associated NlpC family hydrolase
MIEDFMMVDWNKFKEIGEKQLGKPYSFGVEDNLKDADPKAFDCSELVEWLYAQVGVVVPDGSMNQYDAELTQLLTHRLGDVGFFMTSW